MVRISLILLMIIHAQSIIGQTPEEILQKVVSVYETDQLLDFSMNVQYFEEQESRKPVDIQAIHIVRKEEAFYMKVSFVEIIYDGSVYLQIDHEQKRIIIQEGEISTPSIGIGMLFEIAEKREMEIDLYCPESNGQGLCFNSSNSNSSIKLIYDPETYHLISSEIQIDESDRSWQQNNNVRVTANYSRLKISEDRFPYSINMFVTKQGSSYKPLGKVEGYRILF